MICTLGGTKNCYFLMLLKMAYNVKFMNCAFSVISFQYLQAIDGSVAPEP